MSLVSLRKQAKMSFVFVNFNKEVGESGEFQTTYKPEFCFVSFNEEVGEYG